MNSTSSSYWQEQQLMDAMVAGLKKNRGKLQSSTDSENDGSATSATSSEASDDRVRNWLDVRAAGLCLSVSLSLVAVGVPCLLSVQSASRGHALG